jgi:hypothetical protein
MVHHGLKGGGRIRESEEHYSWLVKPEWSDEGCLPFVSWFDSYVVVAPPDVEFSEQGGFSYCCYEVRDEGEWVAVLNCMIIQLSVVLDRS